MTKFHQNLIELKPKQIIHSIFYFDFFCLLLSDDCLPFFLADFVMKEISTVAFVLGPLPLGDFPFLFSEIYGKHIHHCIK